MLHYAVESGYCETVRDLLKCGYSVNTTNDNGESPLHLAAKTNQYRMAQLLICCGADENAEDKNGNPPVFYPAKSGNLNAFEEFRGNARVNPILLRIAVKAQQLEFIEYILQKRSLSVDTPDIYGQTALYFTAYREQTFMDSCKNKTPFTDGVEVDIAKLLLDKGSKVNIQTNKGVTPLHAAIENRFMKLIDTLLEYDVNVNAKTDIDETVLHVSIRKDFEAISKRLLYKGANVNVKLKYFGITPLHIAVYKRNENTIKLLLRLGANPNCSTKLDLTPLHMASVTSSENIVKLLLKYGAETDSKDAYGRTALHIACIMGCVNIVKLLLRYGAEIDTTDEYGKTALHIASRKQSTNIITILLNHGADINITNPYVPFHFDQYFHISDDPEDTLENTHTILKHHRIKLKALDLFVNEINFKHINTKNEMTDVRIECEKEVTRIKSEKIDKFISFYDILTKNKNKLAIYLKNKNVVQVLKSRKYKTMFPIYANMIKLNFKKGERRKQLLEQNGANDFMLPCIENIFNYLDDKDLINLAKAVELTDNLAISGQSQKIPEMTQSNTTNDSNLSNYFSSSTKLFPNYISEIDLIFAYFERVCLRKCRCHNRKCYTLYQ